MTRAGLSLGVGGLAVIVAGRVLGLPEIVGLGIAGLALLAVAAAMVHLRRITLDVTRRITPATATVGDDVIIRLDVENVLPRRCPAVLLVDPITHHDEATPRARATVSLGALPKSGTATASYRLSAGRRGLVLLGPMIIHREDPFGLCRRTTVATGHAQLLVLPVVDRIAAPRGGRIDDLLATTSRNPRASDRGEEFASLRGYVPGDDLRRVHWPTSARRGSLMVRKNDETRQPRCTLLLDVRSTIHDADTFERAISATAGIVAAALRNGDEARLITTAGFDSLNGSGDGHLTLLLQELALLSMSPDGSLASALASLGAEPDTVIVVTTDTAESVTNTGPPGSAREVFSVVFRTSEVSDERDENRGTRLIVPSNRPFAEVWAERFGPADPIRRRRTSRPIAPGLLR